MTKFKGNRKLAILIFLLSVGWVVALFVESSHSPPRIMGEIPGLDKVAHFIAFAILTLLICFVVFIWSGNPAISLFSLPFWLTLLVGLSEEGYQILVPSRTGSVLDLLADIAGATIAMVAIKRSCLMLRIKAWFETNSV
ncbi:VanZ family protein [Methylomonas koyamae]|uniref:VanZ family protein n=1 Tax=Methylomonas koyamae TaxID=702114 RepID=UPI0006D25126|nr:VanZ family protein [Methylomonas koyamae]BBL56572.1 hypothetical protein MKFW12EY_01850 [Methylomonas koyamae]